MGELEQVFEQSDARDEQAAERLQQLFPDKVFTLVSKKGSSAVIYQADGLVYKAYIPSLRGTQDLEYTRDEAAKLALLAKEGLGPQIREYIEQDPAQVTPPQQPYHRSFAELDQLVPKRISHNEQTVLVMDKVDFDSDGIKKMPSTQRLREFRRIKAVAAKHKIKFGDVEFVYDKDDNKVKVIDAGGLGKFDPEVERRYFPAGFSDQQIQEAYLTKNVAEHLSKNGRVFDIKDIAKYVAVNDIAGLEFFVLPASRLGRLWSAIKRH